MAKKKTDLEKSVWELLGGLGVDLKDPNFAETPKRVAKMYGELFDGLYDKEKKLDDIFSKSFPSNYEGLVLIGPVTAWGMCPHHLLPIIYSVNIGYVPDGEMIGLSKFPRLIRLLAAQPIMQETFTSEVIDVIQKKLHCKGAMAVVHGDHMCMQVRGIKDTATTTTSEVFGLFADDATLKNEFLSLMENRNAG